MGWADPAVSSNHYPLGWVVEVSGLNCLTSVALDSPAILLRRAVEVVRGWRGNGASGVRRRQERTALQSRAAKTILRLQNGEFAAWKLATSSRTLFRPQRRWHIDWTALNECSCAREKEACLSQNEALREASGALVSTMIQPRRRTFALDDMSLQVLEKNVEHLFRFSKKKHKVLLLIDK